MIEDVAGRPVTAMKVFCTSIRALMNHMFLTFTARGFKIMPKDIRWVLTVPAIWSDAAKQFMRKSANLVNIQNNKNRNKYHKMYKINNTPQKSKIMSFY